MVNKLAIWGGIECTINRIGNEYYDQLSYDDHYSRYDDLKEICNLGISSIRYPILWEKHKPSKDAEITWVLEKQLNYLHKQSVEVIAGLVHHGSGPKYANIDTNDFAPELAKYATEVAKKFPWIKYYTPVNEPLTTARFCGLYGLWYPHQKNDLKFLKILLNECRATVLSMQAIKKINPNAELIFTEDLAKIHSTSLLKDQAEFENQRRWLSIDLVCGKVNEKHLLWQYLLSVGITSRELKFFIDNPTPPSILGFNYYLTSERFLDEDIAIYPSYTHGGNGRIAYADIEAIRSSKVDVDGFEKLIMQAAERYDMPLAITEVHLHCGREDQLRWFQQIWDTAMLVRKNGVKLVAVTAWSLFGAYGWDKLLTKSKGNYEAGAFDLSNGKLRKTAIAKLVKGFASSDQFYHTLINCNGWWQKPTRFTDNNRPIPTPIKNLETCKPILILNVNDLLDATLAQVFKERDIISNSIRGDGEAMLNLKIISNAITINKPWAMITTIVAVNEDKEGSNNNELIEYKNQLIKLSQICSRLHIKLLVFIANNKHYKRNELNSSVINMVKNMQNINPEILFIRSNFAFCQYNYRSYFKKKYQNAQKAKTCKIICSDIDLPYLVNLSLDYLIDDERGIWVMENKSICRFDC